ncbi:tetratricopeptide repeat protein [Candidatus Woesebacteria bacterium]|nr:tetratricopeptide repeat protein [Candidatus Woesebacteria bacterium]
MNKLEKYLLYLTIFLLPVVFANVFSNFFDLPKIFVLCLGVALTLLIVALRSLIGSRLTLSLGNFDFPLLLLLGAYLISAFVRTPNKMDAFFFPGTATVISAGVFLYFLLNLVGVGKKTAGTILFLSATSVAVFSLLATAGVLAKIPQLPNFVRDASFSPTGALLPQALFLGILLPIGISLVLSEKGATKKLFFAASLAVSLLALALTVFNILPGKPSSPALPPYETSWAVAVESLKGSPLLGVGPGNYLTAFSRFKPLSYNATRLWALRFTTATNFPLTLLAETGLLGLTALVLLYWRVLGGLRERFAGGFDFEKALLISLIASLILLVLFPANIPFLILTFVLLALNAKTHEVAMRIPRAILTLPIIAGVLTLGYYGSRAYLAEYKFRMAINRLIANEGKGAYDSMREAIRLNPYVDRYHTSYAQVNMALARAIAQNENITDTDRTTISQLIQQAVREGRATVTLNPQRSGNWEVLARTYQAIMPFAQGADNFAIQSFNQAVALDPTNPNLRIALGGVYYALGRYDEAIRAFELAVLSKPDLANAHYNLASAYREKGEIDKAIEQINAVLSLVEKDSRDYEVATTELTNLEKKKPAKAGEGENLTPPAPAEKPVLKPPLTLPEEGAPPATPTP